MASASWREAGRREGEKYGVDQAYVESALSGESSVEHRRTWVDWLIVIGTTAIFGAFARVAEVPHLALHWGAMVVLITVSLGLMLAAGAAFGLARALGKG